MQENAKDGKAGKGRLLQSARASEEEMICISHSLPRA